MITTSTMHIRPNFRENTPLKIVVAAYLFVWIVAAIGPIYPTDWVLENLLVLAFVVLLVLTYGIFPLSDLSYMLIALFMMLHAAGAHYTYAETPFGYWMKDTFSFRRNAFDRLVHFSFGLLLAYPIREVFLRLVNARGFWAYYFPLDVTLAFSALYEIIEMIVAKIVSPEAGDAYLGTQGDPFDAVMDMTCAVAGAVISMAVTAALRRVVRRGPQLLTGDAPT